MKKTLRKLLAVVLSLAVMLSVVLTVPFVAEASEADFVLGEPFVVTLEYKQSQQYSFTPSVSGKYRIYTVSELDTDVVLMDAWGNSIYENDDIGGYDFTLELSENESYTIEFVCYDKGTTVETIYSECLREGAILQSFSLNYSTLDMYTGDNKQLSLTDIYPADAGWTEMNWTSSDQNVATVDSEGVVTAVGGGTAVITATSDNGCQASCTVTVTAVLSIGVNEEITVYPVELGANTKIKFVPDEYAEYRFYADAETPVYLRVQHPDGYFSAFNYGSDEEPGTSFKTGEILTEGETYIIDVGYYGNESTASITLGVQKIVYIDYVEIVENNIGGVVGESLQLTAKIYPENATVNNVSWSSRNEDVATVDQNGVVTLVGAGSTYIRFNADGYSDSVYCTVQDITYEEATVDTPIDVEIENSDEYVYYKIVPEESGTYVIYSENYEGDPRAYLYDRFFEEIGYNDDDGDGMNFRIECELTAGETYYIAADSCREQDKYTFYVRKAVAVESFDISYSGSEVLFPEKSCELDIINVAPIYSAGEFTWSVSDENVASLEVAEDGMSAILNAITSGTVTVTVIADGKTVATKDIVIERINEIYLDETETVSFESFDSNKEYNTKRFKFVPDETARYEFYAQYDEDDYYRQIVLRNSEESWLDSQDYYSSDENGVFCFQYDLEAGETYYLDARLSGTGSYNVTVTKTVEPTGIEFYYDDEVYNGLAGEIFTLGYKFTNPHADESTEVVWSSSDEQVVSVDGSGELTLLKDGEAVITVTCGNASDSVRVVVKPVYDIVLDEDVTVNITKANESVCYKITVSESGNYVFLAQKLTADIYYNLDVKYKTGGWVDNTGRSGENGEIYLNCYLRADREYYYILKANAATQFNIKVFKTPALEEVALNGGEEAVNGKVGDRFYLTYECLPKYSYPDVEPVWTVEDESVAEVNPWGYVELIGEGETTVTVSFGEISDSIKLIVTDIPKLTLNKSETVSFPTEDDESVNYQFIAPEDGNYVFYFNPENGLNLDISLYSEYSHSNGYSGYYEETIYNHRYLSAGEKCKVTVYSAYNGNLTLGVIKAAAPESIVINGGNETVKGYIGTQIRLITDITPVYADKTVSWSSSNEEIATVDEKGNVTLHAIGEAVITVTAGEVSDTITVKSATMPVIALETETTVSIDNEYDMEYYSFTPSESGYYTFYSYSMDADTRAYLYNANRTEQLDYDDDGGENNNFKITYYLEAGERYCFAAGFWSNSIGSFPVMLRKSQRATNIILSGIADGSVFVGEYVYLGYSFDPIYSINEAVKWSVSDESILRIDSWYDDGVDIYGVSEGTAVITVTTESGLECSNTITVKKMPELELDKLQPIILDDVQDIQKLTFTPEVSGNYIFYTTETPHYIRVEICGEDYDETFWSEEHLDWIGDFSFQCSLKGGVKYYIYTNFAWGGVTGSYNLGVTKAVPPTSIAINDGAESITGYVDSFVQLEPTVEPERADLSAIKWSSDNEKVAIVNEYGYVEIISEGTATITATVSDTIYDSITINAVAMPEMPVGTETSIPVKENNEISYYKFVCEETATYQLEYSADKDIRVRILYDNFNYRYTMNGYRDSAVVELYEGNTYFISFENREDVESASADVLFKKVIDAESIEILEYPEKMTYYEAGDFNYYGLKLKVTFEDGSTAIWSAGDGDTIGGLEVSFGWHTDENDEYECSIIWVGSAETTFKFNIEESPVVGISLVDSISPFVENYYGYDNGKYFEYSLWNHIQESSYKVTFKDGTEITLSLYDEIDGYSIGYRQDGEWTVGGNNYITVSFMGFEDYIPVVVIENPVKEIKLVSGSIELIENYDGFDTGDYFRYEPWSYIDNLTFKVIYKDGSYKLTKAEEYLDDYFVGTNDDQDENPWTVGTDNYLTVSYLGVECAVPVTIVENPIDYIEINSSPTREYIYGDSYYGVDYGSRYWFNPRDLTGLSFTVHFKNRAIKTYTWQNTDSEDEYYWDGYEGWISGRYVEDIGYQEFEFTYFGATATVEIKLIESPLERIEVVSGPAIKEFTDGFLPILTGTELKLVYTDGTSEIVTVTEDNIVYSTTLYGDFFSAEIKKGEHFIRFYLERYSDDSTQLEVRYLDKSVILEGYSFRYSDSKDMEVEKLTFTGDGLTVVIDGETYVYNNPVCDYNYDPGYSYSCGYVMTDKGLQWYGIEFDLRNGYFEYAYIYALDQYKSIKIKAGDVNDDGAVDVRDLVAMKKAVAEGSEPENMINADMDLSGALDSVDLGLIKRLLVGQKAYDEINYGDVNDDVVIDVRDLVAMKKAIAENTEPENMENADMDQSKKLDSIDLGLIRKQLVGLKV